MTTTGDQQLVKRINRSVLLRLLRAQSGLSRAQLAQASGLTKSTVSLLVRELIDEGWLSETSVTPASGQGRPPVHPAAARWQHPRPDWRGSRRGGVARGGHFHHG